MYIEREAARELMYQKQDALTKYDLDSTPVADVVEVVRCNDCKHSKYRKSPFGVLIFTCELLCADIKPIDFCSYGERRGDHE